MDSRALRHPTGLSFVCAAVLLGGARDAAAQDCPSCVDWGVTVYTYGTGVLGVPRNGTGLTALFRVEAWGNFGDDYNFTCTSTGGVTCGVVSPTIASLA